MKIYILEQRASINTDEGVFSSLVDWMPFLEDLIEPITDKKVQLAVGATHKVDTLEDYAVFQRYFMAGQLILGAILITAERAYKINNKDSSLNDLPSEKLLKTVEFQDFLKNKLDHVLAEKIEINLIKSVETADSDILVLAQQFSEIIFNPALVKNVEKILTTDGNILMRTEIALESMLQKQNEQYINLVIESTGQPVMVYFNGCDDQFTLIDKWLDAEDMQLPVSDQNTLVVSTPEEFLDWFNRLRLRLENECSYQTLMDFVGLYDLKDQERYKKNINDEIKKICEAVDLNDHEKRKQVVAFCNSILNKRKNIDEKHYSDLTMSNLDAALNKEKDFYILSIYQ